VKLNAVRKTTSIALAGFMAAGVVFSPSRPAHAQSVESLQKQLKTLQQALDAVKSQLDKVQAEQKVQKTKLAKQGAEVAPLKKVVERLSKVSISGGATGIVQGTWGVPEKNEGGDDTFSGGSFDLVFEYEPMKDWKVVIDLEGIGGNGPDNIATLHGVNGDLGTTNDTVTILEAYLEGVLWNERLTLTAGKIDATNYIDGNAYAGDETTQFLSGSLVNNGVLTAPDNGPGVRLGVNLITDLVYLEMVGMSQDPDGDSNTTNRTFEHVYGALEVGITPKLLGRSGTYRFWGTFDGNGKRLRSRFGVTEDYTAMGAGLSFDQEVADGVGLFFRLGYRDTHNTAYTTRTSWSLGTQLFVGNFIKTRPNDFIGLAYSQISPTNRDFGKNSIEEQFVEGYYNWYFTDNFQLTGFMQYVDGRNGSKTLDDVTLFGARVQSNF
jgi:hypothetical protein